ncbi:MAG: IucA/IucC family siderophore biosynthesis protein [Paenibacillus sp.]|jgi:siderophore synthetase component|nr:IucA/IucC family siderophore biosynthesis protein [Paenibacillus sp.]
MSVRQTKEKPFSTGGNEWLEALRSPEYSKVERRIIRQLIESLVYEGIVETVEDGDILLPAPSGVGQLVVKGTTAEGLPVSYVCLGSRKKSFGRVRLSRYSVVERVGPDGGTTEASLTEFVSEALAPFVPESRLGSFLEELGQTLIKDTQAQYANSFNEQPLIRSSYDELEGSLMDGHPYHPCYKSRIGFNLNDNAAYGPEFQPVIRPLWLAVRVEDSMEAHSVSLMYSDFFKNELGSELWAGFLAKLELTGGSVEHYRFIPVHPWQWRETTVRVFHRQLAEGRILVLGEGGDDYRPQQSIRTLANASSKDKAYLKLPMNLVNTSTGRILAKHTILNAPLISDWLSSLIEHDEDAQRLDFVLLREVAGVTYNHEILAQELRPQAYGTLGAIWRESLHPYLRSDERAVPFNGLCHVERSGSPLIDPWVQAEGVEAWARQLLKVSVEPLVHLLFAHGVALESHAQNMILIHRDGRPVRVAFKDFHDGIRFSRHHLADPSACPALNAVSGHHARINPNSFIETDDASAVRDFVHDAFFFINLTEVCFFLEEHYGLPEEIFWRMTAQVILDYRQSHPRHEERYLAFDLFAKAIRVEQLTARRLFGDAEIRLQEAPNPLYPYR